MMDFLSKKIVFVIDDDPYMRDAIRRAILSEMPSYDIVDIESGDQALEYLKDVKPDIILLDIMMKGLNGLQTLQHLKNGNGEFKNIPVLMLTSVANREIVHKARKLGAEDYIMKPINKKILVLKIKNYTK